MMTTLRFPVLLLLVAALFGCADDEGELSGSLTDFYDLSHSEVRARLYSSGDLSIEYVREDRQIPLRVTVQKPAIGAHDLGAKGDVTGRVGDRDLPPFAAGTLTLEKFSTDEGARVQGKFDARFDVGRDQAGLNGGFDTTLEVVERLPGYEYDAGIDTDAEMR